MAPARPAPPPLPAPGFARGLPAPASVPAPPAPAPAPPVVTGPARPAPVAPAPAPRPAPPPPQPAPRFGRGLPAPEAAPAPRPVPPIANGHGSSSASAAPAPVPRPARPRPTGPLEIGRVRYEDLPAILDLVNADLLPGQPTCGRHALDMAMRGESPVDTSWWRELSNVRVAVASRGGVVVGAVSYAIAAADRSGWLLWLHAREERTVVEPLIDHALGELTGSSHLYAFWIATALSLGVEALPVEQRPVTHELLTSRGLTARDSWRYLVLPMERFAIESGADEVAAVRPISGPGEIPAWELVMGDREEPVASAEIALAGEGCGVLWWIDVEPAQRGHGIGRRLLRQALRFLALRGAQSVAAFVDHADPRERDPSAILRLLGSAGFQEADRLWSYESPRRRR
jgi:GNAT superfamily N-acetyltransferase